MTDYAPEQHSISRFNLHSSALSGDPVLVRRAILAGADVNALDAVGRSALMCAVAGEK